MLMSKEFEKALAIEVSAPEEYIYPCPNGCDEPPELFSGQYCAECVAKLKAKAMAGTYLPYFENCWDIVGEDGIPVAVQAVHFANEGFYVMTFTIKQLWDMPIQLTRALVHASVWKERMS